MDGFENDYTSIFGIFDGHGGNEVSKFLSEKMPNVNIDIKVDA